MDLLDDGLPAELVRDAHKAGSTAPRLRWFLVDPAARGHGLGTKLVNATLVFCREQGYPRVILWTVNLCTAAARLYRAAGFQLVEQKPAQAWGRAVDYHMAEKSRSKSELNRATSGANSCRRRSRTSGSIGGRARSRMFQADSDRVIGLATAWSCWGRIRFTAPASP